ncbi:hypothetical protein AB0O82_10615 [Kitasatospora sp. NPDC088264]|uniref:hypothetical protein n=1 Tax=Kitasatospora sp. NPDC088264 TaxID=3155296 RepID=UPI00343C7272
MSHNAKLAPLPDHYRVHDALWQRLYANYAPLITPLREKGWVTDVELSEGAHFIRATLGDGTELHIGTADGLPLDPREVAGWLMIRQPEGANGPITVLYNSTRDGAHRSNGGAIDPVLARIARLRPAGRTYRVLSTIYTPFGSQTDTHPCANPVEANEVFDAHSESFTAELWTRIYAPTWPPAEGPEPQPALRLSVWALGPDIAVLRIAAV